MTTDKTGYAVSIELPVGVYHLREIDPPTGFILSDEVTGNHPDHKEQIHRGY